MDRYWVVINGKPDGPFTLEDLKRLPLAADTFVKQQGMADFKELQELASLAALFDVKHLAVPLPQYYAGPETRILAALIDYLILLGIYLVVMIIVLSFVSESYLKVALTLSGLALLPSVKAIVSIFYEASEKGASPGKRLLGLRVTDSQGARLSLAKASLRNVSKALCFLTLGIGYVSAFFQKKHQALHDLVAGTIVIKDRLL